MEPRAPSARVMNVAVAFDPRPPAMDACALHGPGVLVALGAHVTLRRLAQEEEELDAGGDGRLNCFNLMWA